MCVYVFLCLSVNIDFKQQIFMVLISVLVNYRTRFKCNFVFVQLRYLNVVQFCSRNRFKYCSVLIDLIITLI